MDLSFPKKEHLCYKRRFDALLAQGKSFFIFPFRVIYLLREPEPGTERVQITVSVRKKQFKRAVTRNLIKRRFRESYRHQKSQLHACLASEGKSIYILMVYGAGEVLPLSEIDPRMTLIIKRLTEIVVSESVQ